MRPGWAPDDFRNDDIEVFTDDDRAWLDLMWEPTGQPARVVDIRPDSRLSATVLR